MNVVYSKIKISTFWKINYNYSSFKSTCVCVSLVGLSSLFSGGRRGGGGTSEYGLDV